MANSVTAQNFEQEVLKSSKPVVIDVFATWCGPCRMMSPIVDELAKELEAKFKIVKINIDEERDIAIKYSVSSIPTFLFFKDGNLIGKEMGFMSKEVLQSKIEKLLG
jgi:thioredoxin 1